MNTEERHYTLKKLKEAKMYWLSKINGKTATTQDGVNFMLKNVPNSSDGEQDKNGNENNYVKRLKTHPGTGGLSFAPDQDINQLRQQDISQLPKTGFTSALLLASITFVVETVFLIVSYFLFK